MDELDWGVVWLVLYERVLFAGVGVVKVRRDECVCQEGKRELILVG